METEIDLRPLVAAILRRWRLIMLCMITAVALAMLLGMMRSQTYTAHADILILASRSSLELDERFVTSNTQPILDGRTYRESLVALAESALLENEVRAELPPEMVADATTPNYFTGQIKIETTGDLIQIQASNAKEAEALALVDAWGQVYVRTINELYNSNTKFIQQLEQQIELSRQKYAQAQQEYEAFLTSSEKITLGQRKLRLEGLLQESNAANQSLYNMYMARIRDLELILQDAQTLRQQNSDEQFNSFARSLAVLSLRARTVGGVSLPVQLQLDNIDALTGNTTLSIIDLDQMIAALEQRRDELIALNQELAQSIAAGQGSPATLPPDVRAAYEEELAAINQRYEQLNAQEGLLRQERDLSLEALSLLQRKLSEQRIVEGTPEVSVRFVDTVSEPPRSRLITMAIYGMAAAILGMGLGLLIAIYLELVHPRLAAWRATPPEHPIERPVTGQDIA